MPAKPARSTLQEVLREEDDIVAPRAQRWDDELNDGEAVVQVGAETCPPRRTSTSARRLSNALPTALALPLVEGGRHKLRSDVEKRSILHSEGRAT